MSRESKTVKSEASKQAMVAVPKEVVDAAVRLIMAGTYPVPFGQINAVAVALSTAKPVENKDA